MILPVVAPISTPSLAVSREGAVTDFILSVSAGSFATGGDPSAEGGKFSWQVLEIDSTFPEVWRSDDICGGGDFPSPHALAAARSLCADLDRILPNVVSFSDIEAFEGDLLLHWRSDSRGVTLICPADSTRKTKLYREQLDGNRTTKTDIAPDPRASDLAKQIQWVWNRD